MKLEGHIPFGAWWCTPFCKWQGSLAGVEPLPLAASSAVAALAARGVPLEAIESLVLGTTVPSRHSFYGAPWVAGLMGLPQVTGATLSQACATSAACLSHAAHDVASGGSGCALVVAADRTSNGPTLIYPKPDGSGGTSVTEHWVLDNFSCDPIGRNAMVDTAENVARELGIERSAQDQLALLRHEQYQRALADDRAFQKRYMLPAVVADAKGRVRATVESDEGVFPTTADGLEKLRPVVRDGSVTFGTQTHPADGNAGMLVTDADRAREYARDPAVRVRLVSAGRARVKQGFMPLANAPAVRTALQSAGIGTSDLVAVTTHLPFAVNDLALTRELDLQPESLNRFGCSLVWGHPQAPTGLRSVIELIEELAQLGGGYGLFTGCAAGDSAMALVVRVETD
ncbi:MAG: thiolase family protein [Planctomycetota bacterium]